LLLRSVQEFVNARKLSVSVRFSLRRFNALLRLVKFLLGCKITIVFHLDCVPPAEQNAFKIKAQRPCM
jgi:hypothetical protein